MRSLVPVLLVLTLSVPAAAAQLQVVTMQPAVDLSRHRPEMAGLSPTLRDWVSTQARATLDSGSEPDAEVLAGAARARLGGQDFSEGDIESLVQLVLQETARQADTELRNMMEQMRSTRERKAGMREAAAAQRDAGKGLSAAARAEYAGPETKAVCVDPPCQFAVLASPPRQQQIKLVAPAGTGGSPPADADSDADSMSEMGEMDQLKLQMSMDRRAKFIEALSNIMKKQSDTASTITSNLK